MKSRFLQPVSLILTLVLLVAAGLRLAYYLERSAQPDFSFPVSDAGFHDYWARGLASGDWTPPPGFPDPEIPSTPFFRPPGYPYFLAGIYRFLSNTYQAPVILQLLMGVWNVWLAFVIGRRWFGDRIALLWAGFMATYWSLVFFEGELLEPPLLVNLTLVFLWSMGRWIERPGFRRGLIAGVVAGLLALTRPNMLAASVGIGLWAGWKLIREADQRRAWLLASVGFATALFALVAVSAVRNYRVSGEAVLITSNAGINLFIGNNDAAQGIFNEPPEIAPFGSVYEVPQLLSRLEQKIGHPMGHAEASRYFSGLALSWISSHPDAFLILMAKKVFLFWGSAIVGNNKADSFERAFSPVLSRLPGSFALMMGLALPGFLLWFRRCPVAGSGDSPWLSGAHPQVRSFVVMSGCFVLFGFLSYWPFFAAERYRLAWLPLVLLFAACGVGAMIGWFRSGQLAPAGLALLAAIAGYAVLAPNWADYQPSEADWYYYRGVGHMSHEQFEQAEAYLRKAWEVRPHHTRTLGTYGLALLQLNRNQEAAARLAEALRADPDRPGYLSRYGIALARLGKNPEAIRVFTRALALTPDAADLYQNLGLALARTGRTKEALAAFDEAVRLDPQPEFLASRGVALQTLHRTEDAVSDFRAALEGDPENLSALNGLAWHYATMPQGEPPQRKEAVALAERACRNTGFKDPSCLDTLAAAYASVGRFTDAIATSQRALELLGHNHPSDAVAEITQRLALYRDGKAFYVELGGSR